VTGFSSTQPEFWGKKKIQGTHHYVALHIPKSLSHCLLSSPCRSSVFSLRSKGFTERNGKGYFYSPSWKLKCSIIFIFKEKKNLFFKNNFECVNFT
jgi:hypothetical protein